MYSHRMHTPLPTDLELSAVLSSLAVVKWIVANVEKRDYT